MNTAFVTGATSGIGAAICNMLLSQNYEVYGVGRNLFKIPNLMEHKFFHGISCDLTDTISFTKLVKNLIDTIPFTLLVNNAGVGYFGPHEELNSKKIHELVTVNLEIPMLLTQLFLRNLKKVNGTIVFISSVTAQKANTHGCAYGATKAGLSSFSASLFDEVRKYGVRVITLHPDMTESDFYRNANFTQGQTSDTFLFPDEIAQLLCTSLNQREGIVLNELTIKPQRHQIKRK